KRIAPRYSRFLIKPALIADGAQNIFGHILEALAIRSQGGRIRTPVYETDPEPLFQLLNTTTEGRLRQASNLSCPREVQRPSQNQKILKPNDLHNNRSCSANYGGWRPRGSATPEIAGDARKGAW